MTDPGMVSLIGSGETSASAGQIYEMMVRKTGLHSSPLQISVLETPAGFEQNAALVATRVAHFLESRLQNSHPRVIQVAARKKDTAFSPNDLEIVAPIFTSQFIFLGPGSPTYTVRQMQNSLAWGAIQARHRLGANLAFASASIIAMSAMVLPVYEIYKVGEDLHWKPGLDLLGPYGLSSVFIPHWNNNDGGEDLDTSRCFMGLERFVRLLALLPADMTVVGIDEHTALTLDFGEQVCRVTGVGLVHVLRGGAMQECPAGCAFPLQDLGNYHPLPDPGEGLAEEVWQMAREADAAMQEGIQSENHPMAVPIPVQHLVEAREQARQAKDWPLADQLRRQIRALGWQVSDMPDGPVLQAA